MSLYSFAVPVTELGYRLSHARFGEGAFAESGLALLERQPNPFTLRRGSQAANPPNATPISPPGSSPRLEEAPLRGDAGTLFSSPPLSITSFKSCYPGAGPVIPGVTRRMIQRWCEENEAWEALK